MNRLLIAGVAAGLLAASGCNTRHEITHKVEPIHMTVDINIRVDRQLDNFFEFEDEVEPATQPATQVNPAGDATARGAAQ